MAIAPRSSRFVVQRYIRWNRCCPSLSPDGREIDELNN